MNKYLCIHGHFYQPPRESPWIEEIEMQESAYPYHDWNERILKECYEPNGYARIVDGNNKIIDIVNNYSLISFNFGPTLLSWLEKKAPGTYSLILDADRESIARWGHGNAIAQAYNHTILPLANGQDRETQVIWGIEDFKYRFKREPEAMWLPETAVNAASLEVLIKQGMKYVILSPAQAQRVRPLKGGNWKDVSSGTIDPTYPYRCFLKDKSGKRMVDQFIDVFFYDGAISGEISFGNLLLDGDKLADRLNLSYNEGKNKAQLIHAATDGETYGHHKKFGEMALAYALRKAEAKQGFTLINYGAFLEQFPPESEVELKSGPDNEGTAWSCAHGVGRWKEDCGCRIQWQGTWNQKWRMPLREALNIHRDNLSALFEQEGARYFKDSRAARNDYIKIILDRSPESVTAFFRIHGKDTLREEDRIHALKLLETERNAQLMFTSCGWFFDEITGLEATQILKYAERALQLAEAFSRKDMEAPFLEKLSEAQSNLAGYGNGKDMYYRLIRPSRISMEKVLNHFAILSAFTSHVERTQRIYNYTVEILGYEKVVIEKTFLITGKVKMTSGITLEAQQFFFALAFLGGYYFRTVIKQIVKGTDYTNVKNTLITSFTENPRGIFQAMTELFGDHYYSLRDMFHEEKQLILQTVIGQELEAYEDTIAKVFDDNKETIEEAVKEGLIIPPEFKVAAEHTLSRRLTREIEMLGVRFKEVVRRGVAKAIVAEAKELGYSLNLEAAQLCLSDILKIKFKELSRNCNGAEIEKLNAMLSFVNDLHIPFNRMEAQNIVYAVLRGQFPALAEKARAGDDEAGKTGAALLALAEGLNFNTEQYAGMMHIIP